MHLQRLVLGALAVLFTATGTHAATIFTANLTHSQESTQGPFLTATGDPGPSRTARPPSC